MSHTVIFGGVNQYRQVKALNRGVDILHRRRHQDAERHHLVNAGVGTVQRAARAVGPHVSLHAAAQIGQEIGNRGMIGHKPVLSMCSERAPTLLN